jgi:formylglycine-generating enzyme required for sulfatase activity
MSNEPENDKFEIQVPYSGALLKRMDERLELVERLLRGIPDRKPELSSWAEALLISTREAPFVNSLGIAFLPVPGISEVWMARTETRVRDFRTYAEVTEYAQEGGACWLKVVGGVAGEPNMSGLSLSESVGGDRLSQVRHISEGNFIERELDEMASWNNPGFQQSENHPVVCVSWEESQGFCRWLSEQEPGLTYRLPMDAEWSAAAGPTAPYPWGSKWPPPKGAGNYFDFRKEDSGVGWPDCHISRMPGGAYNGRGTSPVGNYKENQFGFFDISGNVWEWCEDEFVASMNDKDVLEKYPALKDAETDSGPPSRVARGGSWSNIDGVFLRSSLRLPGYGHPDERYDDFGFRLVVCNTRSLSSKTDGQYGQPDSGML